MYQNVSTPIKWFSLSFTATGATTSQGEWCGERASSTGEFVARGGQDAIATYVGYIQLFHGIRNTSLF